MCYTNTYLIAIKAAKSNIPSPSKFKDFDFILFITLFNFLYR